MEVVIYFVVSLMVFLASAVFERDDGEHVAGVWTVLSLFWPVLLAIAVTVGPLWLLIRGWVWLNDTASARARKRRPGSSHLRY